MSYDVAVWIGDKPADDTDAFARYEELWKALEGAYEAPHPRILAYIEDLTKRYPDLMELDDEHVDDSPWAFGPLTAAASGPLLELNLTYSGLEESLLFVAQTAAAHGLVCFDPQAEI